MSVVTYKSAYHLDMDQVDKYRLNVMAQTSLQRSNPKATLFSDIMT